MVQSASKNVIFHNWWLWSKNVEMVTKRWATANHSWNLVQNLSGWKMLKLSPRSDPQFISQEQKCRNLREDVEMVTNRWWPTINLSWAAIDAKCWPCIIVTSVTNSVKTSAENYNFCGTYLGKVIMSWNLAYFNLLCNDSLIWTFWWSGE